MNKEALLSADDLLTTSDVARLTNRTPDTIRHWERIGVLPARKTAGGQHLFRRDDVERLLTERRSLR
jgi:excisionase family DNA binding protein